MHALLRRTLRLDTVALRVVHRKLIYLSRAFGKQRTAQSRAVSRRRNNAFPPPKKSCFVLTGIHGPRVNRNIQRQEAKEPPVTVSTERVNVGGKYRCVLVQIEQKTAGGRTPSSRSSAMLFHGGFGCMLTHTNRAANHTAAILFITSTSTPVDFAKSTAADHRIMASQLFW